MSNRKRPSWPGFVPAIHVLLDGAKDVDARDERGHDGRGR
jgi:hypothetical protein